MGVVKVLVIDDSALVRQTLLTILNSDPDIEVIGAAPDPYSAVEKIKQELPDVITLDVEMPRMDGITFLKKLMSQHPIPVVVISTLTEKGTKTAIKAMELGALEVVAKPKLNTKQHLEESGEELRRTIKNAAVARVKRRRTQTPAPKYDAGVMIEKRPSLSMIKTTERVIAVGASTGGTEAIKVFLDGMKLDSPGVVIVQHMPEMFTRQFAKRLNDICKITVKEAENGDVVMKGHALIAPGHSHMLLKRDGARYIVEIKDGPLVNRHKPSVDVLFRSVARYAGSNATGVLLTGMGADGAKGLLEMKEAGAYTVAQDEASSVVFGMPREAILLNAHNTILPLGLIAPHIVKFENEHKSK